MKDPDGVQADTGYVFDYWTSDKTIFHTRLGIFNWISPDYPGTHFGLNSLSSYWIAEDLTLTAHFKRKPAAVTYKTDGHGTVGKGDESVEIDREYTCSEETLAVGKLGGTTATSTDSAKYAFDYWTADKDIYKLENDKLTTITAGTELASLEDYYVSGDVTFIAHFRHKPATVTYTADDHGTVGKGDESVEIDREYTCGEETLAVGKLGGTTATSTDSTKYAFDYWTADKDVYKLENDKLTTIAAGTAIASPEDCYVADAVTFTAHFKQISGNVTYTSAGHGSVSPKTETLAFTEQTIDAAGTKAMASTPSGVATSPDAGYEFDYWTANIDVISVTDFSVFAAGDKIRNEQLGASLITKDATFTAHFKHKPARVSYTTDGHGSVDKDSESVEIDKEYKSGENVLPVGQPGGATATPFDSTRYAFDYWTADKDVYTCKDDELTTVAAGTRLDRLPVDYYVAEDVVFTAHFLRTAYDVTYKTAGHGTVSPASEKVAVGNTPIGCTITPDKGYEFGHWTANVSVEVANESAPQMAMLAADDAEPQTGTTTIAAGEPITDEQLKRAVSFSGDPVFTAHFKQTSSKTDDIDKTDDPSTPSTPSTPSATNSPNAPSTASTASTPIIANATSATSNSNGSDGTGNSGGNPIPATGDAVSGATVAFFFCAGIAAALAAFFRRRNC